MEQAPSQGKRTVHCADALAWLEGQGVLAGPHNEGFGYVVAAQAFKRKGLPSDIAPAVAFLASEKAGWITGQTLVVDGGHTRN